jgi:hypothetical protein
MGDEEIQQLFLGYGHIPLFIEGDAPKLMHRQMADAMDQAIESIRAIQRTARDGRKTSDRPKWPMIVLRSPKGWTGPKEVDGLKVEGFWRAHQVPIANPVEIPSISSCWNAGCAAIDLRLCSMASAVLFPSYGPLRQSASGEWAPIRMPMVDY